MDYNTLAQFNENEILAGMETYYQNANDLLSTSEDLEKLEKYGIATALLVLSIEECIKAFAVFQVLLGMGKEKDIDAAFKGNSIHKERLKLASYYNTIISFLNSENLKKAVEEKLINLKLESGGELTVEDFLNKTKEVINPESLHEILCIPENFEEVIEKSVKEPSNWFLHAQKNKEKGLYADYIDRKWHLPNNNTFKNDYEIAYKNAKEVFETIGNLIQAILTGDDQQRRFVRDLVMRVVENRT